MVKLAEVEGDETEWNRTGQGKAIIYIDKIWWFVKYAGPSYIQVKKFMCMWIVTT